MNKEEELFTEISEGIEGAVKSQMFGKACFKINSKAFLCFFQDSMVFKLTGEAYKEALSFDGSKLFDPSGKGRPMKEWVQLPFDYKESWNRYAQDAADYMLLMTK